MALTRTNVLAAKTPRVESVDGGSDATHMKIRKVFTITFDSSYPTGGESLTATDLGLDEILFLEGEAASGYVFSYDYANSKLLAYMSSGSAAAQAQVANTTDLSAVSVRVMAIGIGTA